MHEPFRRCDSVTLPSHPSKYLNRAPEWIPFYIRIQRDGQARALSVTQTDSAKAGLSAREMQSLPSTRRSDDQSGSPRNSKKAGRSIEGPSIPVD